MLVRTHRSRSFGRASSHPDTVGHHHTQVPHASTTALGSKQLLGSERAGAPTRDSRQRLHTHARDSKQAREHIQTEGVGERGVACRHTQCAASVVGFTALSCSFHSAETHGCELCTDTGYCCRSEAMNRATQGRTAPRARACARAVGHRVMAMMLHRDHSGERRSCVQ
jgi:hypothetical protein